MVVVVGGVLLPQLPPTPLLILVVVAILVLDLVDLGVVELLWVVYRMLELAPKHQI